MTYKLEERVLRRWRACINGLPGEKPFSRRYGWKLRRAAEVLGEIFQANSQPWFSVGDGMTVETRIDSDRRFIVGYGSSDCRGYMLVLMDINADIKFLGAKTLPQLFAVARAEAR